MGLCVSSKAARASRGPTAKLILPDGELREFDSPVTVSNVLQREPAGCFVCDADEIDFDGFVSALRAGEELRQGQLYFVLPDSALERPLRAEDLAALAVKASRALMTGAPSRKGRRGSRAVAPLVFASEPDVFTAVSSGEDGQLRAPPSAAAADAEMKRRTTTRNTVSRSGMRRKFMPNLGAISE